MEYLVDVSKALFQCSSPEQIQHIEELIKTKRSNVKDLFFFPNNNVLFKHRGDYDLKDKPQIRDIAIYAIPCPSPKFDRHIYFWSIARRLSYFNGLKNLYLVLESNSLYPSEAKHQNFVPGATGLFSAWGRNGPLWRAVEDEKLRKELRGLYDAAFLQIRWIKEEIRSMLDELTDGERAQRGNLKNLKIKIVQWGRS